MKLCCHCAIYVLEARLNNMKENAIVCLGSQNPKPSQLNLETTSYRAIVCLWAKYYFEVICTRRVCSNLVIL